MHESRLKADELEQLRRWGSGLQHDLREEVSAAGRAIVLLIEEIERLHVVAWDRRLYPDEPPVPSLESDDLPLSLRRRLRQRLRPHLDPTDEDGFHR